MEDRRNLVRVKMEKTANGPPSSPSTSSYANALEVAKLKDDELKKAEENYEKLKRELQEIKKMLAMEVSNKSTEITNLKAQLAMEREKYTELENFAYQSGRELIEMLGDLKTCLDVAIARRGKEDNEDELIAQLPLHLTSLKENLGKMEENDRLGISKELGFLWGVIRRIKLKLTAEPPPEAARQVVEKVLDQNDEDLNIGTGTSLLPPPIESMEVDLVDDDEVIFLEVVQKVKIPEAAPPIAQPIVHAPTCTKNPETTTTSTTTGLSHVTLGPEEVEFPSEATIATTIAEFGPFPLDIMGQLPAQQLSGKGKKGKSLRRSIRLGIQRKRGRPLGSTKASQFDKRRKIVKRAKCNICEKRLKNGAAVRSHKKRMHSGNQNGDAVDEMPPDIEPDVGPSVPETLTQEYAEMAVAVVQNQIPEVQIEIAPCEACEKVTTTDVGLPVKCANVKME